MSRRRLQFLVVALLVAWSLTTLACQRERATRTIAIATLMSHPALDAVEENLKQELTRQGFAEGTDIRYLEKDANGQVQLAAQIADELNAQDPAVIVAITTPMAQAVARNARVPIVFAAVTDPVGAGVVESLETGQPGITGTSDAWPYEDQLRLIRRITPDAKSIGLLYNPGEAAAQYGVANFRRAAPRLGFELIEGAVSSTSDVYPVAQNLAPRVDALLIGSDNTVISGVAAALKVAVEHRVPLYVGDSGTVEKGGLATVSVGYAELGRETGRLVARVLRGEDSIPTVVGRGVEIYVNRKAAELMGVNVPQDVIDEAVKVYDRVP